MSFLGPYIGTIKAVALLAIALSLFATGHHFGALGVQAKWDADKLATEQQAETLRLLAQSKINKIDQSGAAKAQRQAKTDQKIIEKVDANVPSTLPLLPGSFRVQHDSAATGKEIDDSRSADDSPVAPRTVAKTVSRNYADARSDKERLAELQAIIRASGCFDIEGE
jgi:hypothetical protein